MTTGIAIGVHVHACPAGLERTLARLRANTSPGHAVLVLPDGADDETARALGVLRDRWRNAPGGPRVLDDAGARGGAAALNRLAAASEAEVVVLLESGAVPAPGWLDELLAALASSPRAGLAGPATNRSWNEQGVCRREVAATDEDVARTGADRLRRYGGQFALLAPLYSLADFCYAVRRDVFRAIGPADEGYGLGPCWELDFNARAARAGFDGLWARGAYVWRAPFTPRRAAAERDLFEASRHRYQDRFCGARARGARTEYREHCRGDACPDFAPTAPVPVRIAPRAAARVPLASCIMPTSKRLPFVRLALECFRRQRYPERELIVVDDGTEGLEALLAGDPRVRYVRTPRPLTVGAKRNLACGEASGDFIVHWDDDDWHGPRRLELQLAPLLSGDADITGLENRYVLELEHRRFWTTDARVHRSMFVGDVHGGTIAYRRAHWTAGLRYPDSSIGEDAYLLRVAARRRLRLRRVENDGEFIYVRHGANTWRFAAGAFIDPGGWRETTAPPEFGGADLDAYYQALMALRT